ncbi:glycosyltransferase family 2 protein [Angustibacter sp. McL0619]|uniref:glycosyltransferase family 2 protein n=1 Tax=Angustibacter sp. McL0619 TaxID=3415676 RepID=UPI003CF4E126
MSRITSIALPDTGLITRAVASPELAIVMPAHNEGECIRQVVAEWLAVLDALGLTQRSMGRIIVVNDSSTDDTSQTLTELEATDSRVSHVDQACGGHGAAVLHGYRLALQSGAQFVFQVDSDNEFDPGDFASLWPHRHGFGFVFGLRVHRSSPRHRRLISLCLRFLLLLIFQVRTPDANVPYRLMDRGHLAFALQHIPTDVFIPNVFMSIVAHRQRISVHYVPISHRQRTTGKVSIHSWRLLRACADCLAQLAAWRLRFRSVPPLTLSVRVPDDGAVTVPQLAPAALSIPQQRVDSVA